MTSAHRRGVHRRMGSALDTNVDDNSVAVVSRSAGENRLGDISAAAIKCFGRLGFRRTKMAEVAAAAGLSTGALYNYVESKEALFHLAIAAGFGEPPPTEIPMVAPPFTETLELIDRDLRLFATTPLLKAAASSDRTTDIREELAAIVAEQYDMIRRVRRALSVIEACASDLQPLEDLYFGRRRRGQIDLMVRYLQKRHGEGYLADLPDLAVGAQLIHEATAWFAWKRLEGHDAGRFDDESARATVIEFCRNALVKPT